MFGIKEDEFAAAIDSSLLRDELVPAVSTSDISEQKLKTLDLYAKEREYQRILRSKLSSRDGNTLEDHDQFYRDHKLLLILFRALAVMPVVRTAPGSITFAWKSAATVYAMVFWCLMSSVVVVIGRERLHILQTTRQFDEYIYAIIFVVFLIPHFWIPFVGWGVAQEVALYKNAWGTFQLRFYRVTGTSLQFPKLKSLILLLSIGCLLCAIMFLWTLSFLLEGFPLWHTLAYYHIIIMINMNCSLWYINSRAIKIASNSLAACFHRDVTYKCTAAVISKYRFLWLNLSELLQALGNAYTRTYSTYCIFLFVNISIAVYGAFAEIVDHKDNYSVSYKEVGLIVDAFYCAVLLFVFCDCSHKATLCVAKGVQQTLLAMDMRQTDQETRIEIDHFIVAIEMNPAIVSLKGYVEINRELITSSIATITIYLLVLIQFKFTLDRAKMDAAHGI